MAAEEHSKAAEAYTAAIERSHDESVRLQIVLFFLSNSLSMQARRTLRMLYNEHRKAAKELQRKVDKLTEEGKDPSLPQKPELPKALHTPHNSQNANSMPRRNTSSPQHFGRPLTESNMGDESFMLLGGQRVRVLLSLRLTHFIYCIIEPLHMTRSPTPSQIQAMHSTNSGI